MKKTFRITLHLNNKYETDSRDPCGYTIVSWFFSKYDRTCKERSIFGKIIYMNSTELHQKFNVDKYVKKLRSVINDQKNTISNNPFLNLHFLKYMIQIILLDMVQEMSDLPNIPLWNE